MDKPGSENVLSPFNVGRASGSVDPLKKPANAANNISERIHVILSDQLGISESHISLCHKLREDLGADSLDLIELIMAFAQEFGRDIFDEDACTIQTVGEMVAYVEHRSLTLKLQRSVPGESAPNEARCLIRPDDLVNWVDPAPTT